MKNVLPFLVFILFLFGCAQNAEKSVDMAEAEVVESMMNRDTIIEDEAMMLGLVDREGIIGKEFNRWFDSTYQAYNYNPEVTGQLSDQLSDVDVKIYMGTWCSDTQRDLPAFFKIIDNLPSQPKSVKMIATDRSKLLPPEALDSFVIEFIPHFLFSRDGEQLGEIIEMPEKTLEEDMLSIIGK